MNKYLSNHLGKIQQSLYSNAKSEINKNNNDPSIRYFNLH